MSTQPTRNQDPVATAIRETMQDFAPSEAVRTQARRDLLRLIEDGQEAATRPRTPRAMTLRPWRLALAACLTLVAATSIVAIFTWRSAVTLADVEAAVGETDWIHLRYDTGREVWFSSREAIVATVGKDGFHSFSDYHAGLSWWYHDPPGEPWGRWLQIRERDIGRSAGRLRWVDFIELLEIEQLEERSEGAEPLSAQRVERIGDVLDDATVIRFDVFEADALGEPVLARQLWVDPETRLPIQVRHRLRIGHREAGEPAFTMGHYAFPEQGPLSIHDLGIPRDVPIARSVAGAGDAGVVQILDAIREARERFPHHYRLVQWSDDESEIDVNYWSGAPRRFGPGGQHNDYRPVRIRAARYFNLDPRNTDYHLPTPATAEQVVDWADTQIPVVLSLGEERHFYTLRQRGPFPPMPSNPSLMIQERSRIPLAMTSRWPLFSYWPVRAERDLERLESPSPGLIGLRRASGVQRDDYILDPARDHICVEHVRWRWQDDEWQRERVERLADLAQLRGGQWVARRRYVFQAGHPDHDISASESSWHVDITVYDGEEMPADTFDATTLREQAETMGAEVETY